MNSNAIVSGDGRRAFVVTIFKGEDVRAASYKDFSTQVVYARNSTQARLLVQMDLPQGQLAVEAKYL